MPTWGEELQELGQIQRKLEAQATVTPPVPGAPSAHDILRRKYLKQLHELTGRAVIVYATAFLEGKQVNNGMLSVGLGDQQGFMEAVSGIQERKLDLFLHSPGGSADAAEAIVQYLRTQFDHIRVVVPVAAMSAATMMALAADEILMGDHSQLGPIDPQLTITMPEGPRSAPAQAIIDQFEMAKKECADPNKIAAWLPILRSYAPGLIAFCDSQRKLAEDSASRNLERYMFKDQEDRKEKAAAVAAWFANFSEFKSHGRRVGPDEAAEQGLKITRLEADDTLQDAVLSVHHAFAHTLSATGAVKIVENHNGRAWLHQTVTVQVGPGGPGMPGLPPGLESAPLPSPTVPVPGGARAARRRADRGK
ncbi:MAG: serine protease [Actinomycetota bacterium]|nr:serine protease [Actinomycetota bacterium]